MKVTSIEFGQVTWIVDVSMSPGRMYFPEALQKIQERYGFVKAPNINELLSPQPNTVFEHGKFGDHVIQKFSIHTDGFLANSQAGTDATEQFLDDLLNWSKEEFGAVELDINDSYRVYDSHLMAQLDINFMRQMKFTNFISSQIEKKRESYGLTPFEYVASGFVLSSDNFTSNLAPTSFTIERRAGQPFKNNLYLSKAPLRTNDHIKLLENIEASI